MKVSILDKFYFLGAVFIMAFGLLVDSDVAVVCGTLICHIVGAKLEILKKLEDMK